MTRNNAIALLGLALASMFSFSSCNDNLLSEGSFSRRAIEPVISSVGEMTKSGAEDNMGRLIATYALDEYGGDSLYLSLYEYDNFDLPSGITETALQTKGLVASNESINQAGKEFTMDAWLEAENRYSSTNPTQAGDGFNKEDETDFHFMKGAIATRGDSSWGLECSSGDGSWKYWRNKVYTNFWSIYPNGVRSSVTLPSDTASDDAQKMMSMTYTVQGTASDQKDVCFAFNHQKWDKDIAGNTDKVDIHFYHALSAIYFDVSGIDAQYPSVNVDFIDVCKTGVCDISASGSDAVAFDWAPDPDSKGNVSQTFALGSANDFDESGLQKFMESDKVFMMIPQQLTPQAGLKITFMEAGQSTGSSVTKSLTWTSDAEPVIWKPGKKYLYKVGKKVENPDESDWVFEFANTTGTSISRSFFNTVEDSSPAAVRIVSKKTSHNPGSVQEDAPWEIESVSVDTDCVLEYPTAAFSGLGYLKATTSQNAINITAFKRKIENVSTHGYWINEDGVSGDTDGSGWSPKSWGSDGLDKGVIDLSKFDFRNETMDGPMSTANCYVIRHAGTYKLPLVYGNAVQGGNPNPQSYYPNVNHDVPNGNSRTTNRTNGNFRLVKFLNHLDNEITNPFIENNAGCDALSCEVVWQDEAEVVKDLQIVGDPLDTDDYDTGNVRYLQFTIHQEDICQNNAVIAIKDADGRIIWSWHIWTTNDPDILSPAIPVMNQAGNIYSFFPLYQLGRVDDGVFFGRKDVTIVLRQMVSGKRLTVVVKQPEVADASNGCYYQWGRKDPLCRKDTPYCGAGFEYQTPETPTGTPGLAIQHPYVYYDSRGNRIGKDWTYEPYFNLWTGKRSAFGTSEQAADIIKTVYDPSPVGYRVPAGKAFTGFVPDGQSAISATGNPEALIQYYQEEWHDGWDLPTRMSSGPETIFFPSSGTRLDYKDGQLFGVKNTAEDGSQSWYWTAAPTTYENWETCSYYLNMHSTVVSTEQTCQKVNGHAIRPVLDN